ncbi:1,4-alpha-glucan branching protein [Streptomyces sp. LP05-1]|uniref:1,4-alpha-glucan branching protein n=1 Tax=Streptomyces pyxinae TaxID=2970734 RepID=A0ABT2CEQ6_9ACTN|nr:1,4-alpha-glucan branching protein [Streptomyces sp. LP05-1]MCS0635893.1 1,4-alpha-glucan branching protein [Streptomyces sp. LP05-1]
MAVIHQTTLTPGKLELLADWLPGRPWYTGGDREPRPERAGGFRLDDPAGEVGLEFMAIADGSGGPTAVYHVPLTYRGAPLDGAEEGLVGTAEHGVLGKRWVYDGAHDPVLVGQLLALIQGAAEPQMQRVSDTPDPSVVPHFGGTALTDPAGPTAVVDGPDGTHVTVETATGPVTLTIVRALRPGTPGGSGVLGWVTAGWLPEDAGRRGPYAVLRAAGH